MTIRDLPRVQPAGAPVTPILSPTTRPEDDREPRHARTPADQRDLPDDPGAIEYASWLVLLRMHAG